MTHRSVAWIGWLILSLSVGAVCVALALFEQSEGLGGAGVSAVLMVSFLAFPTVGALVVSQRPTNLVGWLLCLAGLGTGITSFSAAYVQLALQHHADAQPMTAIIDLIGTLIWPINLATGILLLYVFPDGRALSVRWRVVVWALLLALAAMTLAQVVSPGPIETDGRVPNPLGVPALAGASTVIVNVAHQAMPVFVLLAIISLVTRYRRSAPGERQRIKWFVFGAALMIIFVGGGIGLASLISSDPNNLVALAVSSVTFALGILALPVGVGVGVMRYRLYDIDIIINRTLVYGSLTAVLAALYFGLVIGAQVLTRIITGQQTQSPLVIVLSTLVIAGLFQPLRVRLQRTIDHRFYRSRYDAARTIAAFSVTLRQEVELARLREHLLGVVEETMRPTHTFLWLSKPTSPGASDRDTA